MLERLEVKNFAIIENIDISFKDGLTVLTGETGAGKSLIIDSLSLLLGDRANSEMIRTGFEKAEITGYFSVNNIYLNALLDSLGIKMISNELKVNRVISIGKSQIKVNDINVSLNDLKRISKYLADIHMQFDNEKILNPENYIEIIDGFKYDLVNEYLFSYHSSLDLFKEKKKEYDLVIKRAKEIKEKQEMYEFQLKELETFNLVKNEDNEIKEKIDLLKNYDKIYNLLEETSEITHDDFLDKLYKVKSNIEDLSIYMSEYKDYHEKLNDYYFEIENIFNELNKRKDNLDYNPLELNDLENRLNDIDNLKKKYQMNVDELIEYKNSLNNLLNGEESVDDKLSIIKCELESLYNDTYNKGLELSKIREEIGKGIEKELLKNMSDLSLKARFKVDLEIKEKEKELNGLIFQDNGINDCDFLIETNIGEGLKTLSKTISGGEASRIMLALKALFIKSQKIATVIFDEIDTGISGEIARRVAEKIHEISLSTQVISITHLPQVASMSKNHLKISKVVKNDRTYTNVKELSLDEKIYEIALMISGGEVTESQLAYAKEMVMMK